MHCVFVFIAGPQSPESPSTYNQHAPIPYEQLPNHITSPASVDGSKSLPHRSPHPLKSFSVPGPPPQTSAPTTPTPKHNIGMICGHQYSPSRVDVCGNDTRLQLSVGLRQSHTVCLQLVCVMHCYVHIHAPASRAAFFSGFGWICSRRLCFSVALFWLLPLRTVYWSYFSIYLSPCCTLWPGSLFYIGIYIFVYL